MLRIVFLIFSRKKLSLNKLNKFRNKVKNHREGNSSKPHPKLFPNTHNKIFHNILSDLRILSYLPKPQEAFSRDLNSQTIRLKY